MPHPAPSPPPPPAAAAAGAATDDDKNSSSPLLIEPPLITQAHASANSIFQAHVQTVLKHSSSLSLRHILKSRVHAHQKNELTKRNGDSDDCVEQGEKEIYQVTQDDINKCYCFAKRVGTKWADELQRQGCVELSDIVLHFVNMGHYLEPNSVIQQLQGNNHETNNGNDNEVATNKFATSNTALHSLRRYEPDCDGSSGKPLKYLRPITQEDNESSAAKIAQQIDAMAMNGGTAWHHGWDAIDEAVRRNRERIVYYSGANQDEDIKEEGLPTQHKGSQKRVHFEDGKEKQTNKDDGGGGKISKKRRSNGPDTEYDENAFKLGATSLDLGRHPSSIGDTMISWETIHQSMSLQERRDLIVSSIHPPYPVEDTEADGGLRGNNEAISPTEDEPCVNIVGGLKEVGLTHLFEQTRHLPKAETNNSVEEDNTNGLETFLGASATRASFRSHQLNRTKTKATRKAEKERFGRRAVVMGEKNANYNSSGMASKVKWTTEAQSPCFSNNPRESRNGKLLHLQISDEPDQQRWLECDLGECVLEEVKEDDSNRSEGPANSSVQKTKQKRILAFRSLELAIRD